MFGTRALADHAAEVATKAAADVASVGAVLNLHLVECSKRAEASAQADEQREIRQRENDRVWREGLGQRLDTQDKQMANIQKVMFWAFATVLLTMVSMIGALLHSAGIIR